MIKKKRRRVSPDDVRRVAKEGGRGAKLLTLPEGVREWEPPEEGRYRISVLPYKVTDDSHPDGVDKFSVWYRRPFRTHRTDAGPIVCPKALDRTAACHWCTTFFDLRKKGASDAQRSPFSGKLMVAMNIKDPDDPEKVAVFAYSDFKFAQQLDKKLAKLDRKKLLFFETRKGLGYILDVKFAEEEFNGNKYLKAVDFEFVPRKGMDEKETFAKVVNLDKALRVLDEKKLKKLFLQIDEKKDQEDRPKPRKVEAGEERKPKKFKAKPSDDEEEAPKKKKKKLKKFRDD